MVEMLLTVDYAGILVNTSLCSLSESYCFKMLEKMLDVEPLLKLVAFKVRTIDDAQFEARVANIFSSLVSDAIERNFLL